MNIISNQISPTPSSRRWGFYAGVLTVCAPLVHGGDWPQYRGPTHDGISKEHILVKWPADGPRLLWKAPFKDGFSSFSVSQGEAFTLVAQSIEGVNREMCEAVDADTGKMLWAVPLGIAKYTGGGDTGAPDNSGGDGPRSTPTVDGGRVYAMSARLILVCLDAKTGKTLWSRDLVKEHNGKEITWQNAASPLIDGDLVFVGGGGPGEALLGIDKNDGHVVWKAEDDEITHSTPVVATIHDVRQIIFFTRPGLVAVSPKTGAVLWRYHFDWKTSTAISPVVGDDIVYCAAGYGVGSGAVKIAKTESGFTATELWRNRGNKLCNHWSTPVYKEGYLYGVFVFRGFGTAPLKCIEIATGKEMWSQEGFGPGNCILAGDHLVVLGDAGQLVLAEASPKGYVESARAKVLEGKCWSTPSLSDGRIYVRSTKEGACLDVSSKAAARE